jgi:hypothetical protein
MSVVRLWGSGPSNATSSKPGRDRLAFCEGAVIAGRTAYDRVGTRSNENEPFCSREDLIRMTVATPDAGVQAWDEAIRLATKKIDRCP